MELSKNALRFYRNFPIEKELIERMPAGMTLRQAEASGLISLAEKIRMVEFFISQRS